ncbi:diguanylate cyclase [Sulfurimonas sp. HSL3-7]|uniref:diguanylate cyclase n=1 Tax=Sulfonitrofixus jiaomeiensis TaxID=3131938 RepID=UPI0031F77FEF
MKIKMTMIFFVLVWITLVSASFLWNYSSAKQEQERIALESARSFFDQIVITRIWNSRHGGVYVPVTEKTQPNPYLEKAMREIDANETLTLTKVNPAFMTRQLAEIALEQKRVQFHITSLKPIRPQNRPSSREEKFLKEFETGIKEKGEFIKEGEKNSYFYMAPLLTYKSCLQCHANKGYKEGDIRGGISVTLPFVMKIPFLSLLVGHVTIGLLGLLGIVITGGRLKKIYEIMNKQAVLDALTGVPNRRSFTESLLKEYKRCQREHLPLSIIMCDVDKFKEYNDTYGHMSGDLCLIKVAQMVQASLNRPSDFVARYGGEEFVVLLPTTSLEGAMHIAETIRSNIEKMAIPHKNSSPLEVVTLSLGVATSEGTSDVSYEQLVTYADMALYKAKDEGRNRVISFREVI